MSQTKTRILVVRSFVVSVVLLAAGPVSAQAPGGPRVFRMSNPLNWLGTPDRGGGGGEAVEIAADDEAFVPFAFSSGRFQVRPRDFVGRQDECFPGYPAGSNIVSSEWVRGLGLPDNGQQNSNPADPRDNPAKRDRRFGLLLSKNGPTPDCSASGARLTGTGRNFVIMELGFDYRGGSQCGGGAPRFNVITTDGLLYFVGCSHGTKTPAPQDPGEWTRVRFDNSAFNSQLGGVPPFQMGVTRVERILIINDEGTDTPTPEAPSGVGMIILDNILLNGHTVTGP